MISSSDRSAMMRRTELRTCDAAAHTHFLLSFILFHMLPQIFFPRNHNLCTIIFLYKHYYFMYTKSILACQTGPLSYCESVIWLPPCGPHTTTLRVNIRSSNQSSQKGNNMITLVWYNKHREKLRIRETHEGFLNCKFIISTACNSNTNN